MYLRSTKKSTLRSWEERVSAFPEATAFLEQMRNKEVPVFVSVHSDSSIVYEALKSDRTIIRLDLSPKGECEIIPTAPLLQAYSIALAIYVAEEDAKADEATLRRRYKSSFSSLYRITSLSKEERKEYIKGREQLLRLKNRLCEINETKKKKPTSTSNLIEIAPKFALAIPGGITDYEKMVPAVVGKTVHKSRSFSAFLKQVESNGIVNDGKGRVIRVGMPNWSKSDQQVLFGIAAVVREVESRYYSYRDYDNADLCRIFLTSLGVEVLTDDRNYKIEDEVRSIDTTIEENGTLTVTKRDGTLLFAHQNTEIRYSDEEQKIYIYSYKSQRQMLFADFVAANPKFPYELFEEEFATEILPVLENSVQLSDGYQKKIARYKNLVEFYLTLETEGDAYLEVKTRYMSHGEEVNEEEFKEIDPSVYSKFVSAIKTLGLPQEGKFTSEDTIGSILSSNLSSLADSCSLYLSNNIVPNIVKTPSRFSISTESGLDWFEVNFQNKDYDPETIAAILGGYKKKKKFVRVGSSFFSLDDPNMKEIVDAFYVDPTEDLTQEHLPLYKALRLKNTEDVHVTFDEGLQNLFERLLHYSSYALTCPPTILDSLRPYQKNGVQWLSVLAKENLGGILADDMGLGKTLEMIAYLSQEKEDAPTLIVCPKSLLFNWRNEFRKWNPSTNVVIITGSKKGRTEAILSAKKLTKAVFVISYDSLRIDEELFQGTHFSNVILDEAQYIANALAKKTKAVKSLDATHRFVLTGTPIQNSLMDLWSIMDFLLPGYLDGFNEFRSVYQGYSDSKEAELKALESQVAPFILRRTKEEVLQDLPPKSEDILTIAMEPKEKKLYEAYLANINNQRHQDTNRIAILAEITRLRQLCVDPSSFMDNFHDLSSKLSYTISMIGDALQSGHKVLVFSSFVSVLKHLQDCLNQNDIRSELIYGDIPAEKRLELAEEFNRSSNLSVMLVSLKAGGTGLNLVGADIVIHLDPWWNVAAENQASDRAHRIGQTRPVSVFKLVAEGTVEEKMIALQEMKKNLSGIIRVSDGSASGLTEEDIAFLLS